MEHEYLVSVGEFFHYQEGQDFNGFGIVAGFKFCPKPDRYYLIVRDYES